MPSLINVSIVLPNDLIGALNPCMVPVFFNVFTLAFIRIPSLQCAPFTVVVIKPLFDEGIYC